MAGSAPAQSGSVLLRIDDTSPRLQYSQEWEQSGADEDYLATSHVSHSTGSSVKFSFNGTFVTVYGSVGTDGSSSSYVLDGAPPITSNVQSVPSPQYNWPFFYPDAQLEPGLHELVITVTSGTYSLDYIEYTSLADEENVGDASRLPASSSSPSPSPTSRLSSPGLSSSTSSARGIPSGAIAGIAIAAVSVLLAVVVAFFCIRRRRSARKVRPQSHLPEKGIGVLFDGQPKESEAASRSPFRRLSLSRVYRPTPARSAQSSKTATSSAPTSITQSSAMFTSVIMISPALSMVSEESSLHDSPNRLGA